MSALKAGVVREISAFFPFEGKKNKLRLTNIYPGDTGLKGRDVGDQLKARLAGRTWSMPVYGDVELIGPGGKVIDRQKKLKLASIPHITQRYSFIVDGTEYQVDNLWRLKSGAYSRVKENGELETAFNLIKGHPFDVAFDPKTLRYALQIGSSNIPLYSVLRNRSISDSAIKVAWGDKIHAANSKWARPEGDIRRMAAALGSKTQDSDEADDAIESFFNALKLIGTPAEHLCHRFADSCDPIHRQ